MALLEEDDLKAALTKRDKWSRAEDTITREFELTDFTAAIAFINQVAAAAEEAGHHPDIGLHGWNKVRFSLSTHSEGGLTENDFDLAGAIDRIASSY